MALETPIACTLTPAALAERREEWRAIRTDALLAEEERGRVVTTRWRAEPGIRQRFLGLVEAERVCCPFLDLRLQDGDPLVLTIELPADAGDWGIGLLRPDRPPSA